MSSLVVQISRKLEMTRCHKLSQDPKEAGVDKLSQEDKLTQKDELSQVVMKMNE